MDLEHKENPEELLSLSLNILNIGTSASARHSHDPGIFPFLYSPNLFQPVLLKCLLVCLFIWKSVYKVRKNDWDREKERQRERQIERISPVQWFTTQKVAMVSTGPARNQESGTSSGSPTQVAETQTLWPDCHCFSQDLTENSMWSLTAKTKTSTPCEMPAWQMTALCLSNSTGYSLSEFYLSSSHIFKEKRLYLTYLSRFLFLNIISQCILRISLNLFERHDLGS